MMRQASRTKLQYIHVTAHNINVNTLRKAKQMQDTGFLHDTNWQQPMLVNREGERMEKKKDQFQFNFI